MKRIVEEVRHRIFGTLHAVSAGRCDSGRYLVCRTYPHHMPHKGEPRVGRKILVDGDWWLDAPERIAAVFQRIWAPIRERELRRSRHDYRIDAQKARAQHRAPREVVDDYGEFSTQRAEADDPPAPVELLDMEAQPEFVSMEDVARMLHSLSPADLLAGRRS